MNKVSANIGKDIFVLPSRIGEDVFAALQVNSKVSFEVANAAPAVDLTHWGGSGSARTVSQRDFTANGS